ncbi:Magnesium transporter MRS2-I [Hibiscus syriacus]|uniref:Magnesium transporter MRS2-I n=1 Tax=Hibiscus syriacus TaxID=106335 RepID=A0A6A2X0E0_HIBSY|nr:Magnesium transporter MRS2-I [Hibiscus syriacus]
MMGRSGGPNVTSESDRVTHIGLGVLHYWSTSGGSSMAKGVPADPQAVVTVKKKAQPSRNWVLLDSTGETTLLDVDKYAIMHRVNIHARDLRILEPLLSYPSTILGRDGAIVLNLEHIKAIITSEEVLLRGPSDENVVPVVQELHRHLPPVNAIRQGQDYTSGQNDVGEKKMFSSSTNTRTRDCGLSCFRRADLPGSKFSRASVATVRGDENDVEELEMLLELREYIDDTEDYINIQLDNHRNQLIQLELFLSSGTVCLSFYSLVAAIFPYTWNDNHGCMFKWVVIVSGVISAILFVLIMAYARFKNLVGS